MGIKQLAIIFSVLALCALSLDEAVAEPEVFSTRAGAINGFDPVAYFEQAKAIKGKKQHSYAWQGARWFFSSESNLELFKADPDAYLPQYGGYCAYAMSKGSYAPGDPEAWTIYDGKLYLNYSKSVRNTWKKNIPGNVKRADSNWGRLQGS
ncbi:MAG: YHS domain-containing (seleno)protein [Pseudomonadota bacterium]